MKLIVGLGNPGKRYETTRHNIGFKVASALANKWQIRLNTKVFKSFVGKGKILGEEIVIALPQTYMNNSGEAVKALSSRKKVGSKDLLVICDDVNLPLGLIRIRQKGSSGGHKGLESLIGHLGTEGFSRLRVGIEKKGLKGDLSGYVLSAFDKNELAILEGTLGKAILCCETWIKEGAGPAACQFNIKKREELK